MNIVLLKDWDYEGETYKAGTMLKVDTDTGIELTEGDDPIAEAYVTRSVQQVEDDTDAIAEKAAKKIVESLKVEGKGGTPPIHTKEMWEEDPKLGYKHFHEYCVDVYRACDPTEKTSPSANLANVKAMSISDDHAGGFLVPPEFSNELLRRSYDQGQVLSRVRRIPMATDQISFPALGETSRADGSRYGGISVTRTAEAAQRSSSDTKLEQVTLTLAELTGLARVSNRLLQKSAISLEPILMDIFSDEFTFVIENEIIRGNGGQEMEGVLSSGALVSIDKETGQAADTIVQKNISKMWARMFGPSRRDSKTAWFINQDIEPQLDELAVDVGTGGTAVYMPPGGLSDAPYGRLKGKPVIAIEQCSTLGDKGDIILANFNQYLYGFSADGLTSASSIHLWFDYAQTAFRFDMLNDGQTWERSALTPANGSNTQSSFVTLKARA